MESTTSIKSRLESYRANTYQTIATDDIGAFVAMAFERPAEFIGKEPEIAGSELTNPEAAKVFSRVLGKPVKFQKLPCSVTAGIGHKPG